MKRSIRFVVLAAAAVLMGAPAAPAAVKLHAMFTDGAVLQREVPLPVWGTADDGEKVTVEFAGQKVSTVAKDGKWMVRLRPLKAGGPLAMTVTGANTVTVNNLLVGEVWICSGQSNMGFTLNSAANAKEAIAKAADPMLRLLSVPRVTADAPLSTFTNAAWLECTSTSAASFTAVGYFFGRDLRTALKVPVGLINTSWGGTPAEAWTSHEVLEANSVLKQILADHAQAVAAYDPAKAEADYQKALAKFKTDAEKAKAEGKPAPRGPSKSQSPTLKPQRPSALYNAMIAPLLPYGIRGAIWYQGESNNGHAAQYRTLFPAMIANWRQVWGEGDFPFLFVQIAPHQGMTPELREAQLYSWQTTPKTAMAVITDVGEATDIHPKKKEPVGARLALAARTLAYGEKIEYSGPVYAGMKTDGDRAILSFAHVGGGLVAQDGALKGFTIAAAGTTNFVPAEAAIEGATVVVRSPQMEKPGAVRYGWANVPDVNLFNREGLPATPFRTDAP